MPAIPGGVPPAAAAVASRYRRFERPVSGATALGVASLAVGAILWLPLLRGLAVAVVVLAAARVPVFRSAGTAQLRTAADPTAVRSEFESGTPPPLALQWGIADAVRRTETGAVYEVSYLFGVRSTRMALETRSGDDTAPDIELVVTANGQPWATYAITLAETEDGTEVAIEVASDRRFGVRRLPQWLVAERYRAAALAAQGYEVTTWDVGLTL